MKKIIWGAMLIAVLAVMVFGGIKFPEKGGNIDHLTTVRSDARMRINYQRDVQPILARRCVVCHGCYDAPCQLKLSSTAGILRGASKEPVYNSSRLKPMQPTRLFVDADTTQAWRLKGFASVTKFDPGTASLLKHFLDLGRSRPVPVNEQLPPSIKLDIDRPLTCPSSSYEFEDYSRNYPFGGMPYGTAPLSDKEFMTLSTWVNNGAKTTDQAPNFSQKTRLAISTWETLLNGTSTKAQLSARYIYEHLFLAHLYFVDGDTKSFFQLVRSSTAPGQDIKEIDTRHPNSDPGSYHFFYRLRPITATIVAKTHILYPLSAKKLARLRALFFDATWQVSTLPEYARGRAGTPFITFADIPARSRYQFLLDDARYFIMTFIRGPVCRGQVALNVIDDNFFVAFLDPDYDLAANDPQFLGQAKSLIKVPEASTSPLSLPQQWRKYYNAHRTYLTFRQNAYFDYDPDGRKVTLDAIWPGNSFTPVSLLTVFRHFDSASVLSGFVGAIPEKIWVLDYQILERIYYNLVVDYDVFGNITHQLLTRLSMDYTRMEAEDVALSFMPRDKRESVRAGWYAGAMAQLAIYLGHVFPEKQRPSSINYKTINVAREFMDLLARRFPQSVSRLPDKNPLARLTRLKGGFVRWLPDLSLLKVEGTDKAYTLIHNKAHENVAFMIGEDLHRTPDDDTLTVVEGIIGNYPNLFFHVSKNGLPRFIDEVEKARELDDFYNLVETYGVRRSSSNFWVMSDWFNDRFAAEEPTRAGLLDLNRYGDF